MRIPDLFGVTKQPLRLYDLLLAYMFFFDKFTAIVEAARKIRSHARRSGFPPRSKEVLSTYWAEREALWYLREYRAAWQQQLRYEADAFGGPVNLKSNRRSLADRCFVADRRAPLHFVCGRYAAAAECREFVLRRALEKCRNTGPILSYVTNEDEFPTDPARFTLRHAYEAMGKRLSDWPGWETLIRGLKSSSLRAAGTTRQQLLLDDSLLNSVRKADHELSSRNVPMAPPFNLSDIRRKYEDELLPWFPFLRELLVPRE